MGFIKVQPPVFAHRGASEYAPENTIAAFTKAVQLGVKWIEFDVMLTSDHVPVIMHDATLDRTTNGHGAVSAHTVAEIKALDAGTWFDPTFSNERVPTLAETIDFLLDVKISANVELKPVVGQEDALVRAVLHVMQDYLNENNEKILFSSFSVAALLSLRQQAPNCQIGLLLEDMRPDSVAIAQRLHCVSININHTGMTFELAQEIKSLGYTLCCYTVDDRETAQKLLSWGVDAVFSNAPDRMLDLHQALQSGTNELGYRFKL